MGLDLLDLEFRLEKRFGIRIEYEQWEQLAAGRKKFDATAAEICAIVEARRAAKRQVLRWQPDGTGPMVLDYQPRGDGTTDDEEETWPGVRDAIAKTLGIKPENVRPDSWLVRDLGLST
jgi:acyl carrier protein